MVVCVLCVNVLTCLIMYGSFHHIGQHYEMCTVTVSVPMLKYSEILVRVENLRLSHPHAIFAKERFRSGMIAFPIFSCFDEIESSGHAWTCPEVTLILCTSG